MATRRSSSGGPRPRSQRRAMKDLAAARDAAAFELAAMTADVNAGLAGVEKQHPLLEEIGSTGLRGMSGIILEEWLPRLRGRLAFRVYREMRDNDPMVGAIMFAVQMLIRGVTWTVKPASASNADLEAAEFVESLRHDMSTTWADTLAGMVEFLTFGWSVHELVYKIREGDSRDPRRRSKFTDRQFGWRKLPVRGHESLERWIFDLRSREVAAMVQRPEALALDDPIMGAPIVVPMERALLLRTSTHKDSPEGRSILRNAFLPWFRLKNLEEVEAIGVERNLTGFPVMYVDPAILMENAPAEKKAIRLMYEQALRDIRKDDRVGLMLPAVFDREGRLLYRIELLGVSGGQAARNLQVGEINKRYALRIAQTVLADFVLIGHEKVGSFALASSRTNLFGAAIGAWLDVIASAFNDKALPALFRLNGRPTDNLPVLEHGDIETVDATELAEVLQKASGAGAALFPNRELENWLLERLGAPTLPDEPDDEDRDDGDGEPQPPEPGDDDDDDDADSAQRTSRRKRRRWLRWRRT